MLRSPLPAATVIELLRIYFSKLLAQHCTMHGVFMDVLGMGVLISGESSVGKSELGLELISRGHGLVADDVVDFSRVAPDTIEGRCPHLLANLLEVRGLGLLDIKAIFGETAVRRKMKLRLIVELRRYGGADTFERLPLEGQSEEVLGLPIRKVLIPVASGRNLAVLTEAAVRNTILQLRGIDTMGDFLQRQQQQMSDEGTSFVMYCFAMFASSSAVPTKRMPRPNSRGISKRLAKSSCRASCPVNRSCAIAGHGAPFVGGAPGSHATITLLVYPLSA